MNKNKRTILSSILIMAGFCAYFSWAFGHVNQLLLEEKIHSQHFNLDLICEQMDKFVELDNDWEAYDYQSILAFVAKTMDASSDQGLYAQLFDENLNGLSERFPLFEGTPFDPHDYPELIRAMSTQNAGEMNVRVTKPGVAPYDMHLYYRWVPTDSVFANRLLMVVGVSKYSVNSAMGAEVVYGAAALLLVAGFVLIKTAMLICQLRPPAANKAISRPGREGTSW